MIGSEFFAYFSATVTSAALVWAGFYVVSRLSRSAGPDTDPGPISRSSVYLFKEGVLIDANETALEDLDPAEIAKFNWAALYGKLKLLFPEFPASQGLHRDGETTVLASSDPTQKATVTIEQWDRISRVTITRSDTVSSNRDLVSLKAIYEAPSPIWETNEDGQVIWSNAAYKKLTTILEQRGRADRRPIFNMSPDQGENDPHRTGLSDPTTGKTYWFDVVKIRSNDGFTHYATDANTIVDAEIAQRNFVQTLAKTFAQLSIGLAIFDRNRQLALFNPALIDLTMLPADFLSGRPSLFSFFDYMRDNRVMPEPKNYANWRARIGELVVAATDGRYCETWTLPSGLTYRVTGRPHPDGAIAFLFEDISAEISLARRFRADLELGQSVIDAMDGAVAVFSASGELSICNLAFRSLWRTDPDKSFAGYTLRDAPLVCKQESAPTKTWDRLQKTVYANADRTSWQERFALKTGDLVDLTVKPVDRGATLVQFDVVESVESWDQTPVLPAH